MCPACISTLALIATGVTSTGGLTALMAEELHSRTRGRRLSMQSKQEENKNDDSTSREESGSSESRDAN